MLEASYDDYHLRISRKMPYYLTASFYSSQEWFNTEDNKTFNL